MAFTFVFGKQALHLSLENRLFVWIHNVFWPVHCDTEQGKLDIALRANSGSEG